MIDMDTYEKKYNEALERARSMYESKDDAELAAFIFPELAESEDERIRKDLVNLIEWLKSNPNLCSQYYKDRYNKMLAYLEKQKYDRMKPIYDARESFESALEKAWNDYHNGYENVDKLEDNYVQCAHAKGFREGYLFGLEKQKENPKSADSIPSDCVSDAKCEDRSPKHSDSDGTDIRDTPAYWKGWDDAMKQKEQKHPNGCFTCDEYKKGYESGRLNGFTAGYNKAMKKVEQKEQKPDIEICPHSTKSKSYKENGYPIENCDYGLEIAENILEKTLGKVEGYQSDDGIREHQTAIQAVRDAMKEQKPAEWSEEQEEPDKSLEEAAIDFADNARRQLFTKDYAISSIADYDHGCIDGFKAGAEWQKSQMLKDAVEGEIYGYVSPLRKCTSILIEGYPEKYGDKVRIVILKEEE